MLKSKAKLIALAFVIFAISFIALNSTNYAAYLKSNNEGITNWKVAITSDAKDLKDTRKIKFELEDNPNIAKGKIAPVSKAKAKIEIDCKNTNVPIEILATADETEITNPLKLSAKIDDEEYILGTSKIFELEDGKIFTDENGKKTLTLELAWDYNGGNDNLDTTLGIIGGKISIPVTINVKQHI